MESQSGIGEGLPTVSVCKARMRGGKRADPQKAWESGGYILFRHKATLPWSPTSKFGPAGKPRSTPRSGARKRGGGAGSASLGGPLSPLSSLSPLPPPARGQLRLPPLAGGRQSLRKVAGRGLRLGFSVRSHTKPHKPPGLARVRTKQQPQTSAGPASRPFRSARDCRRLGADSAPCPSPTDQSAPPGGGTGGLRPRPAPSNKSGRAHSLANVCGPSRRKIMQSAMFLAVQHDCGSMDKSSGNSPKSEEKREKMKRTL